MRPRTLLRSAFVVTAIGLASSHGARAADVTTFAAHIGTDGYATIQAAVDAAQPGDVIRVEPGVRNESVTVTFDDPDDALTIDAKDAVIDGVDAPAIAVNGPGSFTLLGGTFRSEATALTASGSDAGELVFNVDGTSIVSSSVALVVERANASVYLLNAFTISGDAVVARDCPGIYVTGQVGGAGGSGLVAERVGNLFVEGLHVERCGADGIRFRGDEVLVQDCHVSDVGRTGIDIRSARSCEFRHSSVAAATYRGISLAWRPGATVTVWDNVVTGGVYGIVARGGDGTIRDNEVTDPVLDGITWRGTLTRRRVEGRPVGLVSNSVTRPGRSAIRVEGSGHRLLANTISLGNAGGRAFSGRGRIAALRGNLVLGPLFVPELR